MDKTAYFLAGMITGVCACYLLYATVRTHTIHVNIDNVYELDQSIRDDMSIGSICDDIQEEYTIADTSSEDGNAGATPWNSPPIIREKYIENL